MKKAVRLSISLNKEYRNKLLCLAELEHRRLNQQIIHMTEFYLQNKVETKNLLEQFIHHQYEQDAQKPDFFSTLPHKPTRYERQSHHLKTSQVLQETRGIIVSDVPEKKIKSGYDSLSS